MFVDYDVEIPSEKSILNIPLLATVLPLAWLTGNDIHVDELDRRFKESMDDLRLKFDKMYPMATFTTRIIADNLIENKIVVDQSKRTALLFSGGVDSTYSLINNIHLRPRLIMYWGVEGYPYPRYSEYWNRVYDTYSDFAMRGGFTFHMVKTNVLDVMHERRIEHDFNKKLLYGTLWERLQHSLVLLSLSAPLSINRFDRFLIAASFHPDHPKTIDKNRPHSHRPEIDENIAWSSLRVKHDGYIPRFEKTRAIAEYLEKSDLSLRVCLKRSEESVQLNCSSCGKCYRTIMSLVQEEINPNICGFNVDNSTFKNMKDSFIHGGKLTPPDNNTQMLIPDVIEYDFYGSKEFFEWFKKFRPREKNVWLYRDIYYKLPYNVSKILDEFYKIMNIDIHEHNPILLDKHIKEIEAYNN